MRHFQEQLDLLLQKLIVMGTTTESMIEIAMRALTNRNEAMVAEVFDKEDEVNAMQIEVDEMAVRLTALQQPVATDVRFLFMASRINTELERIGDQAVNICQNTHYVLLSPANELLTEIPIMAELARKMLRDSISAVITRDCALAESVLEQDEQVDAFRNQLIRTLLERMMSNPTTVQRDLSLVLISRNLERIGDHSTNIAEEVIYWQKGKDVRHLNRRGTQTPQNT